MSLRVTKIIAAMLVVAFVFQELAHAAPGLEAFAPKSLSQNPHAFKIPDELGKIREVHQATSPKLLIHIQDAHTNSSAQLNISKVLENLNQKYKIDTVFVEGGTKNDSLDSLRVLASKTRREQVAKKFLLEGKLSGAEHLSLATDLPVKLLGVEDKSLYDEDLKSYAATVKSREDVLAYIDTIQGQVEVLKRRLFPQDALKLDEFIRQFNKKEKDFTEYYSVLSKAATNKNLNTLAYPNFLILKDLLAKEAQIDFKKANEEQAHLVEILGGEFARQSLGKLKSKDVNPVSFYEELVEKARSSGMPDSEYRTLLSYIEYLKTYQKVDLIRLTDEMRSLEEEIFQVALTSEESKYLYDISKYLDVLESLFSLKISKEDFEYYRTRQTDNRFQTMVLLSFINRKTYDLGNYEDILEYLPLIEDNKKEVEHFYAVSEKRDEVFLQKAFAEMQSGNISTAVLITGGYHTPNLTKLLRNQNVSYIVVTPNVSEETNLERYEKLLLGQMDRGKNPQSTIQDPSSNLDLIRLAERPLDFLSVKTSLLTSIPTSDRIEGARLALQEILKLAMGEAEDRYLTIDDFLKLTNTLYRDFDIKFFKDEDKKSDIYLLAIDNVVVRFKFSSSDRPSLMIHFMGREQNQFLETSLTPLKLGNPERNVTGTIFSSSDPAIAQKIGQLKEELKVLLARRKRLTTTRYLTTATGARLAKKTDELHPVVRFLAEKVFAPLPLAIALGVMIVAFFVMTPFLQTKFPPAKAPPTVTMSNAMYVDSPSPFSDVIYRLSFKPLSDELRKDLIQKNPHIKPEQMQMYAGLYVQPIKQGKAEPNSEGLVDVIASPVGGMDVNGEPIFKVKATSTGAADISVNRGGKKIQYHGILIEERDGSGALFSKTFFATDREGHILRLVYVDNGTKLDPPQEGRFKIKQGKAGARLSTRREFIGRLIGAAILWMSHITSGLFAQEAPKGTTSETIVYKVTAKPLAPEVEILVQKLAELTKDFESKVLDKNNQINHALQNQIVIYLRQYIGRTNKSLDEFVRQTLKSQKPLEGFPYEQALSYSNRYTDLLVNQNGSELSRQLVDLRNIFSVYFANLGYFFLKTDVSFMSKFDSFSWPVHALFPIEKIDRDQSDLDYFKEPFNFEIVRCGADLLSQNPFRPYASAFTTETNQFFIIEPIVRRLAESMYEGFLQDFKTAKEKKIKQNKMTLRWTEPPFYYDESKKQYFQDVILTAIINLRYRSYFEEYQLDPSLSKKEAMERILKVQYRATLGDELSHVYDNLRAIIPSSASPTGTRYQKFNEARSTVSQILYAHNYMSALQTFLSVVSDRANYFVNGSHGIVPEYLLSRFCRFMLNDQSILQRLDISLSENERYKLNQAKHFTDLDYKLQKKALGNLDRLTHEEMERLFRKIWDEFEYHSLQDVNASPIMQGYDVYLNYFVSEYDPSLVERYGLSTVIIGVLTPILGLGYGIYRLIRSRKIQDLALVEDRFDLSQDQEARMAEFHRYIGKGSAAKEITYKVEIKNGKSQDGLIEKVINIYRGEADLRYFLYIKILKKDIYSDAQLSQEIRSIIQNFDHEPSAQDAIKAIEKLADSVDSGARMADQLAPRQKFSGYLLHVIKAGGLTNPQKRVLRDMAVLYGISAALPTPFAGFMRAIVVFYYKFIFPYFVVRFAPKFFMRLFFKDDPVHFEEFDGFIKWKTFWASLIPFHVGTFAPILQVTRLDIGDLKNLRALEQRVHEVAKDMHRDSKFDLADYLNSNTYTIAEDIINAWKTKFPNKKMKVVRLDQLEEAQKIKKPDEELLVIDNTYFNHRSSRRIPALGGYYLLRFSEKFRNYVSFDFVDSADITFMGSGANHGINLSHPSDQGISLEEGSGARLAEGEMSPELIEKFLESGVRYIGVFGRPGAGKGTIVDYLLSVLNRRLEEKNPGGPKFVTLNMGDYFRGVNRLVKNEAMPGDEEKYRFLAELIPPQDLQRMIEGKLASNQAAVAIVNAVLNLDQYKNAYGIFFDGFPRTPDQQELIDDRQILIKGKPFQFFLHILLESDPEVLFQRTISRGEKEIRPDVAYTVDGKVDIEATRRKFGERMRSYDNDTAAVVANIAKSSRTIALPGYVQEGLSEGQEKARVRQNFFGLLDNWLTQHQAHLLLRRAIYLKNLKEYLSALRFAQRALQLDPTNIYILRILAELTALTDDIPQAISYFQTAIELEPDNYTPYFGLGQMLLKSKGREAEAIGYLEKALQLNQLIISKENPVRKNRVILMVLLAKAYAILGNWHEAEGYYDEALKLDPQNDRTYFSRGIYFLERKHNKLSALKDFKAAAEINPENTEAVEMVRNLEGLASKPAPSVTPSSAAAVSTSLSNNQPTEKLSEILTRAISLELSRIQGGTTVRVELRRAGYEPKVVSIPNASEPLAELGPRLMSYLRENITVRDPEKNPGTYVNEAFRLLGEFASSHAAADHSAGARLAKTDPDDHNEGEERKTSYFNWEQIAHTPIAEFNQVDPKWSEHQVRRKLNWIRQGRVLIISRDHLSARQIRYALMNEVGFGSNQFDDDLRPIRLIVYEQDRYVPTDPEAYVLKINLQDRSFGAQAADYVADDLYVLLGGNRKKTAFPPTGPTHSKAERKITDREARFMIAILRALNGITQPALLKDIVGTLSVKWDELGLPSRTTRPTMSAYYMVFKKMTTAGLLDKASKKRTHLFSIPEDVAAALTTKDDDQLVAFIREKINGAGESGTSLEADSANLLQAAPAQSQPDGRQAAGGRLALSGAEGLAEIQRALDAIRIQADLLQNSAPEIAGNLRTLHERLSQANIQLQNGKPTLVKNIQSGKYDLTVPQSELPQLVGNLLWLGLALENPNALKADPQLITKLRSDAIALFGYFNFNDITNQSALELIGPGDLDAQERAMREGAAAAAEELKTRVPKRDINFDQELYSRILNSKLANKTDLPHTWPAFAGDLTDVLQQVDKGKQREFLEKLVNAFFKLITDNRAQFSRDKTPSELLVENVSGAVKIYFNSPYPGQAGDSALQNTAVQAARSIRPDKLSFFSGIDDFPEILAKEIARAKINREAAMANLEHSQAQAGGASTLALTAATATQLLIGDTNSPKGQLLLQGPSGQNLKTSHTEADLPVREFIPELDPNHGYKIGANYLQDEFVQAASSVNTLEKLSDSISKVFLENMRLAVSREAETTLSGRDELSEWLMQLRYIGSLPNVRAAFERLLGKSFDFKKMTSESVSKQSLLSILFTAHILQAYLVQNPDKLNLIRRRLEDLGKKEDVIFTLILTYLDSLQQISGQTEKLQAAANASREANRGVAQKTHAKIRPEKATEKTPAEFFENFLTRLESMTLDEARVRILNFNRPEAQKTILRLFVGSEPTDFPSAWRALNLATHPDKPNEKLSSGLKKSLHEFVQKVGADFPNTDWWSENTLGALLKNFQEELIKQNKSSQADPSVNGNMESRLVALEAAILEINQRLANLEAKNGARLANSRAITARQRALLEGMARSVEKLAKQDEVGLQSQLRRLPMIAQEQSIDLNKEFPGRTGVEIAELVRKVIYGEKIEPVNAAIELIQAIARDNTRSVQSRLYLLNFASAMSQFSFIQGPGEPTSEEVRAMDDQRFWFVLKAAIKPHHPELFRDPEQFIQAVKEFEIRLGVRRESMVNLFINDEVRQEIPIQIKYLESNAARLTDAPPARIVDDGSWMIGNPNSTTLSSTNYDLLSNQDGARLAPSGAEGVADDGPPHATTSRPSNNYRELLEQQGSSRNLRPVIWKLRKEGGRAAWAVPYLDRLLQGPPGLYFRQAIVGTLGEIGEEAWPAAVTLSNFLRLGENKKFVASVVRALDKMGPKAYRAVPKLRELALSDFRDQNVRIEAMEIAVRIDRNKSQAIAFLEEVANKYRSKKIGKRAVELLRQLFSNKPDALRITKDASWLETRKAAFEILRAIGFHSSVYRQAVDRLIQKAQRPSQRRYIITHFIRLLYRTDYMDSNAVEAVVRALLMFLKKHQNLITLDLSSQILNALEYAYKASSESDKKQLRPIYRQIRKISRGVSAARLAVRPDVQVFEPEEFASRSAQAIADEIIRLQEDPSKIVNIVLATGNTMVGMLDELSKNNQVDWTRVRIFHQDEYALYDVNTDKYSLLPPSNPASFAYFIRKNFVDKINRNGEKIKPGNIFLMGEFYKGRSFNIGDTRTIEAYFRALQEFGGADIELHGLNKGNGHLAFAEPPQYSKRDLGMQIVELSQDTIDANKEDYAGIEQNPYAISFGVSNIFKARKIFLLANKQSKAAIIQKALEGPVTEDIPASLLRELPEGCVTYVLDTDAASLLNQFSAARLAESLNKRDLEVLRVIKESEGPVGADEIASKISVDELVIEDSIRRLLFLNFIYSNQLALYSITELGDGYLILEDLPENPNLDVTRGSPLNTGLDNFKNPKGDGLDLEEDSFGSGARLADLSQTIVDSLNEYASRIKSLGGNSDLFQIGTYLFLLTGIIPDVESYLDQTPMQKAIVNNNEKLIFGDGVLYNGISDVDRAFETGFFQEQLFWTRAPHQYASGVFNPENRHPALILINTRVFNQLVGERKANYRLKKALGIADLYPTTSQGLDLKLVLKIWVGEDTYRYYQGILNNATAKQAGVSVDYFLNLKQLMQQGRIQEIPGLSIETQEPRVLALIFLEMLKQNRLKDIPLIRAASAARLAELKDEGEREKVKGPSSFNLLPSTSSMGARLGVLRTDLKGLHPDDSMALTYLENGQRVTIRGIYKAHQLDEQNRTLKIIYIAAQGQRPTTLNLKLENIIAIQSPAAYTGSAARLAKSNEKRRLNSARRLARGFVLKQLFPGTKREISEDEVYSILESIGDKKPILKAQQTPMEIFDYLKNNHRIQEANGHFMLTEIGENFLNNYFNASGKTATKLRHSGRKSPNSAPGVVNRVASRTNMHSNRTGRPESSGSRLAEAQTIAENIGRVKENGVYAVGVNEVVPSVALPYSYFVIGLGGAAFSAQLVTTGIPTPQILINQQPLNLQALTAARPTLHQFAIETDNHFDASLALGNLQNLSELQFIPAWNNRASRRDWANLANAISGSVVPMVLPLSVVKDSVDFRQGLSMLNQIAAAKNTQFRLLFTHDGGEDDNKLIAYLETLQKNYSTEMLRIEPVEVTENQTILGSVAEKIQNIQPDQIAKMMVGFDLARVEANPKLLGYDAMDEELKSKTDMMGVEAADNSNTFSMGEFVLQSFAIMSGAPFTRLEKLQNTALGIAIYVLRPIPIDFKLREALLSKQAEVSA